MYVVVGGIERVMGGLVALVGARYVAVVRDTWRGEIQVEVTERVADLIIIAGCWREINFL